MRIEFSYARGTETNYSWAKDEKEFLRVKKQKEADGWVVTVVATSKSFMGWPVTPENTEKLVKMFGVAYIQRFSDGQEIYIDPKQLRISKTSRLS